MNLEHIILGEASQSFCAGEMTQWVKVAAATWDGLSSSPGTHVVEERTDS